jgi:hypothetical protein
MITASVLFVFIFFGPAARTGLCQGKGTAASVPPADIILKYETLKKEKATALAWSLIVPGGGIFYVGTNNEFGAGTGLIEVATLGCAVYVADQIKIGNELSGDRGIVKILALLFLVTKSVEVAHAFSLVDDYNHALWLELQHGSSPDQTRRFHPEAPYPGPQTLLRITIHL